MIPILYEGTEQSFTSNGLGRLSDAITCKVVEERNGVYELEMTYPISGVHVDELQEGKIILAQPSDGGLTQPFDIYKVTKPLNGVITVNAQHISYRLSGTVVMPFTASTAAQALAGIKSYSATTNPFEFTTDKTVSANFTVDVPSGARGLLCGQQGSILDVFGTGEYEFNRFDVNLWVNRGSDQGVTLRYGKNITDLKDVIDMTNVYTGIAPYWSDGEGNTVTLPEKVVLSTHVSDYPYQIIKSVDFSGNWEEAPSVSQLRDAAQNYVTRNEGWKLTNNLTVSFVALWNTEEYKDIAPLERVKLCDTVHIFYTKYGINFSTKVVKTDYNVLLDRYNSITLGDTYYTLADVFNDEINEAQEEQTNHMQKAIARATKLIEGGLGGHVVLSTNADGEPQEILIMDTDNVQTAVNVIRMNLAGIGFSTHGYNGPFSTAWTIDGHFVADYIDTGTLNANIIKAGTLQDEAGLNYWNMVTGDFQLTSGAKIGNSTIASSADVSSALTTAEGYADGVAATALGVAEGYADTQITAFDTALNQQKVFNKLTNNGAAQGIYLQDGYLYINADYINTGSLNANLITTGILADSNQNTVFNLSTGALTSNNLTIDSTYFKLANDGKITSINADGHKIEIEKGVITGYKTDGTTVSSKLEVGEGYFNIIGKLALNGVVGVSGSTSFVKAVSYDETSLGNIITNYNPVQVATGVSYTAPIITATASGSVTFSGTCTIGTQSGTCSGSGYASLPVSINVSGGSVTPIYTSVGSASSTAVLKYVKTVVADTGTIDSADGLIQTIS